MLEMIETIEGHVTSATAAKPTSLQPQPTHLRYPSAMAHRGMTTGIALNDHHHVQQLEVDRTSVQSPVFDATVHTLCATAPSDLTRTTQATGLINGHLLAAKA